MSDNLKIVEQKVEAEIDPNGAAGSILAQNHQDILKLVLGKAGKYTGNYFVAHKTLTNFIPGTLSWESNAMNNISPFVIKTSKLTADLNDYNEVLSRIGVDALISFKDYVGRHVFLIFQSYVAAQDVGGNDIYEITVKGLAQNINYVYQDAEFEICGLDVVSSGKKTLFLGLYMDLPALELAHPTAESGNYANVDGGIGQDTQRYLWDVDDVKWVLSSGSSVVNTSDLNNDGENGINPFITANEIPTFATNGLSIRDINNVQQFLTNDFIQLKGGVFDPANKRFSVSPLVSKTLFVSDTIGNDTTAVPENPNKPYKTIDAAILELKSNSEVNIITIIDDNSYNITETFFGTLRNYVINSTNQCTVNMVINDFWMDTGSYLEINIPFGDFKYENNVPSGANSRRMQVKIICDTATFTNVNSGFSYAQGKGVDIDCKTLNTNADIFSSTNFALCKLKSTIINASGGDISDMLTGSLSIEFDNMIIDTATTRIKIPSGGGEIVHGNKSGLALQIQDVKSDLFVEYKQGTVITGDYVYEMFNSAGTVEVNGNVSVEQTFVRNLNTGVPDLFKIINAKITCDTLCGGTRNSGGLLIQDSTINLLTGDLMYVEEIGATFPLTVCDPLIKFLGNNFIFKDGAALDYNLVSIEAVTLANIIGDINIDISNAILYTKGKFNRGELSLLEAPFNQYFERNLRNQLIVRDKYQIINQVLNLDTTYIIDGTIVLLTGEYIEVPAGGNLTVNGYGLESSQIMKDVSGEEIFTSPIGGSGGLQLNALKFDSGQGSVFNLNDSTGFNAVECTKVNFENCASLGELDGYRQGLWSNIGLFGNSDGLTFSGTWLGGFTSDKIISRNLIGATGVLFKEGTSLVFNSRFATDANLDIPAGWSIADFVTGNFTNDESLQIQGAIISRAGVFDDTDALYFPNIDEEDSKSKWVNNVGVPNSSTVFIKLKSPDNTVWKVEIDNTGTLTTTAI